MDKEESAILIDTDILINFFDPIKSKHIDTKAVINQITEKYIDLYISIVTEIEFLQGSKPLQQKKQLIKELRFFQSIFITEQISITAKELIIQYSSSHGLMLGDSLIAATALHLDIPLFTLNKKDFRFIADLKLYELS